MNPLQRRSRIVPISAISRIKPKNCLKSGGASSLSDAQLKIARLYGFASWPKLKAHVESLGQAEEVSNLKHAIDANDLEAVKQLMTRKPALHHAPLGYGKAGSAHLGG